MAFIVRVARTAAGKRNGALSHFHPAVLGAASVDALVQRADFDPALIDDVIFGAVSQVGSQAANLGRNVVLSSNLLPTSVPGTTVDRQCGSSQQAIHFAAQAVMSGTQDVVVAGGVEVMSALPIGANMPAGLGSPNSEAVQYRFGASGFYSQFTGAELVASKYGITREDMDAFAASSHAKAVAAAAEGRFDGEIVVVEGRTKEGEPIAHRADEGVRKGTRVEKLATLETLVTLGVCPPPADCPAGRITAGNASQVSDGSAAVLVCNEEGLRKIGGVAPLARVVSLSLAGDDPVTMLDAPIPATRKALERAGLAIDDIDLYEVNEAFACVPLAWRSALGAKMDRLNVNGGACALGHPLGATGAKLMSTLVSEMARRGARYGLQAICEGGGTANAMIVERC